jgi:methionyl-tRNA synthetase
LKVISHCTTKYQSIERLTAITFPKYFEPIFFLKSFHSFCQASKNPRQFCDEISASYAKTFSLFGVESSDFVRTTEERHARAVAELWQRLATNGHIYKDVYQSWYSVQDETFLTELQTEVRPDGVRGLYELELSNCDVIVKSTC